MASTIKLKRSAIAGKVPTITQLELGEVVKAAWDDDRHRQACSLQRHRQIQVVDARGFEYYASHLAPLELLDQSLVPLAGLTELC